MPDPLPRFEEALDLLEKLPMLLFEIAPALEAVSARRPAEGFAWVEQVWHLADLEREGFGVRLHRLLNEDDPSLADFAGDKVAQERLYLQRSVQAGLLEFAHARAANVLRLRSLPPASRARAGRQEGIGRLTVEELPGRMLGHDDAHVGELRELVRELAPGHPVQRRLEQAWRLTARSGLRAA
jgi:hypothetical protein